MCARFDYGTDDQAAGAWSIAAIDLGIPPSDPRAQELASRWTGLVSEFSGGNQEIEGTVKRVWEAEGEQIVQQHDMNPRMMECMGYINQALTGSSHG